MSIKNAMLRRTAISLSLGFILTVPGQGLGQVTGDRFPGERWMSYADVGQAGFDAEKLDAARTTWEMLPSSAFMVIADGAVVADAFNTWDSLGEGHMILGNADQAVRYYERSLELNPDNTNAEEMITRIRAEGE